MNRHPSLLLLVTICLVLCLAHTAFALDIQLWLSAKVETLEQPSSTPSLTFTPSPTQTNTLPFDPTLTTFTPTPSRTPTRTPTITPSKTPSSTRTAGRTPTETYTPTIILSLTYTPTNIPTDGPSLTPTFTVTATPSSTLTFTPSRTLNPCGVLPTRTPIGGLTPTGGAGGDSIGVRTTPCPVTYTPTFTPSQTPTETPTLTPSVTDLPSLTPESTIGPRQPVQLLVNPGMDNPIPDPIGWHIKHLPTVRKDDRMRLDNERGVFVFKSGPEEKTKLKQTILVGLMPMQAGDTLDLLVTYRHKGPWPMAHIKLQARYSDANTASFKLYINELAPEYTTLKSSLLINGSSPLHLVTVTLVNKSQKPKTKIFIDSVELWWTPVP